MKTVIDQLNEVYYETESWHKSRECLAGITNYHQEMIDKGNLCCYVEDGELLGYFEVWLVDKYQMERILNEEKFIAPFEDTTHGSIAYLANLWIAPDDRKYRTMKNLKRLFFEKTSHCNGWTGHEEKRNHKLRIHMNRS